ncbi:MAG: SOS response-associated peptidase [Thalassovita sp.]
MCGRMAVTLPPDAMAQLFSAQPANSLATEPNYNVCPTTQIAVVTSDGETGEGATRQLRPMRWGFVPHWYKTPNDGPLLINARSETIAEKPAFRAACRQRRCLIPASGFFEWFRDGDTKLPWYVTRRDGDPLVMAGIWQDWTSPEEGAQASCAIVTTKANDSFAQIHHRMPVILDHTQWGKWLGEEGHGAATLMQVPAEGVVQTHRVGVAVNSNRATGPELIEPFEDE